MYLLYAPHPLLNDFVDCFWESDFGSLTDADIYSELYVAQYNPNIIFNLSKTYQRDACEVSDSTAVTVNTQAIQFDHKAENRLFGIRFKTGGLRLFSPLAMHELTDDAPNVMDVFGDKWQELDNKIQNSATTAERIAHTEGYLLSVLDRRKVDKFRLVQQIYNQMTIHCNEAECIPLLTKQTHITQRSIDRYFQEFLGLSPKKMSRIMRFEQAFAHLHIPHSSFNFHQFGYYDAAHFSKEFTTFAGMTMQDYRQSLFFVQNLQSNHF
jgi:methylphosphotriester-DNA--protein-cysteine methyltransferase